MKHINVKNTEIKTNFTSKDFSAKNSAVRAAKRDHSEIYQATKDANGDYQKDTDYIFYRELANGRWVYEIQVFASTGDDKEEPKKKKIEFKHKSEVENPCALVWSLAEEMEGARRKDVVAACVEAGVALNTAKTQYQHWYSSKKKSKKA